MEMEKRQTQNTKRKIKIVLLGDKGVGKSSIINKFTLNKFEDNLQATIGVDFRTKLCSFNNSKYKLQLWDTAGQQKYRSLVKGYLRGAHACVFVYDQANPNTFASLVQWITTYQEVSKTQKMHALIFGNKNDLQFNKAELARIKKQTINEFPTMSEIPQLEGSAKTGLNIPHIFEEILENYQKDGQDNFSRKAAGESLIKTFKKSRLEQTLNCCKM